MSPARRFRGFRSSRAGAERRGTVIIMAVGVLAIIAILAVTYVTVVGLDRRSADAVSREVNYQQQVDAVVGQIRALLAADLFGNKVVTLNVPRGAWPKMFEDGEFTDYPWNVYPSRAASTFNQAVDPFEDDPTNNSILSSQTDFIALRDDAWLASFEPVWDPSNNGADFWRQITNLNSAYTYDTQGTSNTSDDQWVRGHGRFVDLAQFFLDRISGSNQANPGTNLLETGVIGASDSGVRGSQFGFFDPGSLPTSSRMRVAGFQIHQMDEWHRGGVSPPSSDLVLTNRDERQWVDTDGDLIPDARWTQLDALGNLYGLTWVVAARVIDASSMFNPNANIEFGGQSDPNSVGEGLTPADVDLYRWFSESRLSPTGDYQFSEIAVNLLGQAFREHLEVGLGFPTIMPELIDIDSDLDPVTDNYQGWTPTGLRLKREQRNAYYQWIGSSPFQPSITAGNNYPDGDLVDLMTYWGTNYGSYVSKIEQRIDGPSSGGYLPGGSATRLGPMRAAEDDLQARRLETGSLFGRPEQDERRYNRRKFITPVNGVSTYSPVPLINEHESFAGRYVQRKVDLFSLDASDAARIFEGFMWGLAPLATDQPLTAEMAFLNDWPGTTFNLDTSWHYGGGPTGLAQYLVGDPLFPDLGGTASGATFAWLTSAMLTANLLDATDADNQPTVIRLLPHENIASTVESISDCAATTDVIELGPRMAHGDVPGQLLPGTYAGRPMQQGDISLLVQACENNDPVQAQTAIDEKGMTIVGFERQPYLREITTIAAYTNVPEDGTGAAENNEIDGDDLASNAGEQFGSLTLIELANPWPDQLQIGNNYSVEIVGDSATAPAEVVGGVGVRYRLPNSTIAPGESVIYYCLVENPVVADPSTSVFNATTGVMAHVNADTQVPLIQIPIVDAGGNGQDNPRIRINGNFFSNPPSDFRSPFEQPVVFQHLSAMPGSGIRTVALLRTVSGVGDVPIDRIKTTTQFPEVVQTLNIRGGGPPNSMFTDAYFVTQGYDSMDSRLLGDQVTGRIMVTSSLSRYSRQAQDQPGFPLYTMSAGGLPGDPLLTTVVSNTNATDDPVAPLFRHGWLTPIDSTAPPPIDPAYAPIFRDNASFLVPDVGTYSFNSSGLAVYSVSEWPNAADNAAAGGPPAITRPFQLWVPDEPLETVSDLLLLTAYGHTCFHHPTIPPPPGLGSEQLYDRWETAGEKLGKSYRYDGGGQGTPYLGVLDPSRFLPYRPGGTIAYDDDALQVPLALRVMDAFNGLEAIDPLQQGRINVNTASAQVMEMLPFVAPNFNVISSAGGILPQSNTRIFGRFNRSDLAETYRDGFFTPFGLQQSIMSRGAAEMTAGLATARGLRDDFSGYPGLATPGELAVLHNWNTISGDMNGPEGFGELGSLGSGASNGVPLNRDPAVHNVQLLGSGLSTDAADDAEERLAIYRAISNIVTGRSDVYLAWFIIRGYDPNVIEGIPVMGPSEPAALNAMDSSDFRPTHESRWLVVLDRSEVSRPVDRPKILGLYELPGAKP